MASALEGELVQDVYSALQAASCPLVEGLHLQEVDSMLQLLCSPSQHRTDILAWICNSINPNFINSKAMRSTDPDVLKKEMAVLGHELMLCKADDLDLIRGDASPHLQLQFLVQLLSLVPSCKNSAGHRTEKEMFLNELFAAENLPHFTQMLKPTLDPWPSHIKCLDICRPSNPSHCSSLLHRALRKGSKSCAPGIEESANVAHLLQLTKSTLEQLQSECEFLSHEVQTSGAFTSPSSLRVAASDLQLLMATFSHVFETDLRTYCSRDPPSFSRDTDIFQRIHQLLLALIMELEMLQEVSEASVSMSEEVHCLQTQSYYWSHREKHRLPDQLEQLTRQIKDFVSLLPS